VTYKNWTPLEEAIIRQWYEDHGDGPLEIELLAEYLQRSPASIHMKSGALGLSLPRGQRKKSKRGEDGLTDNQRRRLPVYGETGSEALHKGLSQAARDRIVKYGHPRGMLGKQHNDEAKKEMSEASFRMHASRTEDQKEEIQERIRATNMERYSVPAYVNIVAAEYTHTRGRGGRRADLENTYFRSSWEANYARYLNLLLSRGEIKSWEYEPHIFRFDGVKRAPLSYTPDFRVVDKDGVVAWHEVKGWMDSKSRSRLKRMAKFYPEERVIIIAKEEYKEIAKWSALIDGWE
jgi:hypothetical protein